ncbi:MAG: hypothetical protein BWY07_02729 [Candidatus Hydrogenedentes bacterium ADurb.Bin170]|nr:MAG: hypothetical protein BWY07_02729 [Candidatus Hydrogenedentes bacterium ADurb.Bin170]
MENFPRQFFAGPGGKFEVSTVGGIQFFNIEVSLCRQVSRRIPGAVESEQLCHQFDEAGSAGLPFENGHGKTEMGIQCFARHDQMHDF